MKDLVSLKACASDWCINEMIKEKGTHFDPDLLILGVPVLYWDIPDAALGMIQRLPQFKNTSGFVFSTFGRCVCNSVPYYLARELQSKGVLILGGAQIAMPHSARMDADTRIGDVETSFGKGEPTKENWGKIQKEGILWGLKMYSETSMSMRRYTYLSPVDWGDSYGSILLKVQYSPKGPPYDNYGFETEILAASIRSPQHVKEAALVGADVATVPYKVFNQMFKHSLTDSGITQFLEDWKKVPKKG